MPALKRRRGFTLMEVLVAVVVMTVGMLGISMLIIEGLRTNRNAIYRTAAVSLAADMAERLRAGGTAPGADVERALWQQEVATQLPGGATATIDISPAADNPQLQRFEIRLMWPEAGRPTKASYRLAGRLPAR
jgi:prepilin-type N-terminal cleavage/methylation domain-containing protein